MEGGGGWHGGMIRSATKEWQPRVKEFMGAFRSRWADLLQMADAAPDTNSPPGHYRCGRDGGSGRGRGRGRGRPRGRGSGGGGRARRGGGGVGAPAVVEEIGDGASVMEGAEEEEEEGEGVDPQEEGLGLIESMGVTGGASEAAAAAVGAVAIGSGALEVTPAKHRRSDPLEKQQQKQQQKQEQGVGNVATGAAPGDAGGAAATPGEGLVAAEQIGAAAAAGPDGDGRDGESSAATAAMPASSADPGPSAIVTAAAEGGGVGAGTSSVPSTPTASTGAAPGGAKSKPRKSVLITVWAVHGKKQVGLYGKQVAAPVTASGEPPRHLRQQQGQGQVGQVHAFAAPAHRLAKVSSAGDAPGVSRGVGVKKERVDAGAETGQQQQQQQAIVSRDSAGGAELLTHAAEMIESPAAGAAAAKSQTQAYRLLNPAGGGEFRWSEMGPLLQGVAQGEVFNEGEGKGLKRPAAAAVVESAGGSGAGGDGNVSGERAVEGARARKRQKPFWQREYEEGNEEVWEQPGSSSGRTAPAGFGGVRSDEEPGRGGVGGAGGKKVGSSGQQQREVQQQAVVQRNGTHDAAAAAAAAALAAVAAAGDEPGTPSTTTAADDDDEVVFLAASSQPAAAAAAGAAARGRSNLGGGGGVAAGPSGGDARLRVAQNREWLEAAVAAAGVGEPQQQQPTKHAAAEILQLLLKQLSNEDVVELLHAAQSSLSGAAGAAALAGGGGRGGAFGVEGRGGRGSEGGAGGSTQQLLAKVTQLLGLQGGAAAAAGAGGGGGGSRGGSGQGSGSGAAPAAARGGGHVRDPGSGRPGWGQHHLQQQQQLPMSPRKMEAGGSAVGLPRSSADGRPAWQQLEEQQARQQLQYHIPNSSQQRHQQQQQQQRPSGLSQPPLPQRFGLIPQHNGGSSSSGGRQGGAGGSGGGGGAAADDWSFARLPLLTNFFGCVAKPPQPLPGEVKCAGVTAHVRVVEHFLQLGSQVRGVEGTYFCGCGWAGRGSGWQESG